MRTNRISLAVIYLTMFLDLVGIGILYPIIPQLLANPDSQSYILPPGMTTEHGYVLLGILITAYPLAQFFAAPILGQLSDRYGRRPVLIVSLIGTAIGYALFAVGIVAKSLPILFFSRILDGITGGNLPVAQATIADVTTPENRARNFGLMGAAFGLGFIIGPYIGGQLADPSVVPWFNATTPFYFAAIMSVINVILIGIFLPETSKGKSTEPLHPAQSLKHIAKAFTHPSLKNTFLSGFFFYSGFAFFTTLFGVFLIDRFGFSEADTGNFYAYLGIWIVITQAFITPRISRLASEKKVLNITMIATGLALWLFMLPSAWTGLLFVTPVFAMFNGLTQANYMAFLSRSAEPEIQGEILGINASIGALSQSIPPVFAGLIAAQFAPAATLYVASTIAVLAGGFFLFFVRHDPRAVHVQA